MRIIPSMPDLPVAELPGFPPQVRGFGFADLISAVAKELRVPFGETELPRHDGAAPFALSLIPAAIHRPVPGEGRAVFAGEQGLHALCRPVLEPVRKFLHRHEVWIEIDH